MAGSSQAAAEPPPAGSSAGVLETLSGFVDELRQAGIPVSLTENLDAVEALRHIPLEDREVFRAALGATLVKNDTHRRAFDTVFDVYFALRGPVHRLGEAPDLDEAEELVDELIGGRDGEQGAGGEGGDGLTAAQLAELLFQALQEGDRSMLAAVARAAVTRYAGMEPGRPVGGTYYLYRTLRQLDFDGVLARLLAEPQDTSEGPDEEPPDDALDRRLAKEEYESRLDALRNEIEAEIRRRLVADRGAEAVAASLRRPLPEEIDFMHASRDELVALRKAMIPLTRKLAARLARKRRHRHHGPLDFRNTVRHSLSYGGVPAELRYKAPQPSKPEIVVIADISGSVAAFARFTLQMVYALSAQFSRVRSFVFIDGVDEVTDYFRGTDDITEAISRINAEADVIWMDGHSDYGHAFEAFLERYGSQIGPKSTVLLLGDARNNYHSASAWVLDELQQKARHVYWLNPEPRSYWDTGDSIIGQYAKYCDGVWECRNLKQLERFVEHLG